MKCTKDLFLPKMWFQAILGFSVVPASSSSEEENESDGDGDVDTSEVDTDELSSEDSDYDAARQYILLIAIC